MVDVQNLTPEEARTYLLKLQEKTRKRQRNYVERKKREGRRRINTFLRAEATRVLHREQQQSGRTVGDILSDALLLFARHQQSDAPDGSYATYPPHQSVDKNVSDNESADAGAPDYNGAEKRIAELADKGFNLAEIVTRLEVEGFPTATGKRHWQKTTVSRIIRRRKGA